MIRGSDCDGRIFVGPEKTTELQRGIDSGVDEKDDFDETSDLCDFGYVLARRPGTGTAAAANEQRGDDAG